MIPNRISRAQTVEPAATSVPSVGVRLWETLPGILSWILVLSPIWATLISPALGLGIVAIATIYFAIRTSRFGPRALLNRGRVHKAASKDWVAELRRTEQAGVLDSRYSETLDWRSCRVTLMIRAYREKNVQMLRDTLNSVAASNWPKDERGRLVNVEVLFATEEDDPDTPPLVDILANEFTDRLAVRQIKHPEEPGTLPGPSTAMAYVGRILYRQAITQGVDPDRWIVADFDSDTIFHPQYLPALVYHFATDPRRNTRAYQPVVLFTTDYWKAPLHSRLSAVGVSVLTLGWNRRPEIAFTGAAASLALLHSVDFWPTNTHSQDSGIQLRLRMKYGSAFRVVGVPMPLWVYPVMPMGSQVTRKEKARAYWRSYVALFRQSARWREGPLDEFVEASSRGHLLLALDRLLNGLERDTLTLLPGIGLFVATLVVASNQAAGAADTLRLGASIGLTMVSMLGLAVFWIILGDGFLIPGKRRSFGRIRELASFWIGFSLYVPIFSSVAGLKTSTYYMMGKRPRGHFLPTPK